MKIVITGGPCSGKTSLILQLEKSGYHIIPEVALQLIEQENKGKNKIYPWTDIKTFMARVYTAQITIEKRISQNKLVFFDRGIVDALVYHHIHNLTISKKLAHYVHYAHYDYVFILDMLPKKHWEKTLNGYQRMQTYEQGVKIHKAIVQEYKKSGLTIIPVPVMSVAKRIQFIEKTIRSVHK